MLPVIQRRAFHQAPWGKQTMHKPLTYSLLLVLLFTACEEKTFEPISYDTVKEVIMEFHFADATAERFEGKQKPRNVLRSELYDQVLDRFDLDRQQFFDSYYYYLQETYLLDSMYRQMIDSLDVVSHDLESEAAGYRMEDAPEKIKTPADSAKSAPVSRKVPAWQQGKAADPVE